MRLFVIAFGITVILIYTVYGQDPLPDQFLEAAISNPTPYVGEQIIYTLHFFDATGNSSSAYAAPAFEAFWTTAIGITSQESETRAGITYAVTTITTILFPNRIGVIEIPSPEIRIAADENEPQRSLITDPITVIVQDVPRPDNGSDYSDMVGQLALDAQLDNTSHMEAEPFVLRLTLTGTSDLERLVLPEEFGEWRSVLHSSTYQSEFYGSVLIGTRELELHLYPPSVGRLRLPMIAIEYFDPVTEAFRTVSTAMSEVEVITRDMAEDQSENVARPSVLRSRSTTNNDILLVVAIFLFVLPSFSVMGIWLWKTAHVKVTRVHFQNADYAIEFTMARLQKIASTGEFASSERLESVITDYVRMLYRLDSSITWNRLEDAIPASARRHLDLARDIVHEWKYASEPADITQVVERLQQALKQWNSVLR